MSSVAESDAPAARWPLAALLVVTLVAAALRICQARQGLWLDELHTAWCAVGPGDEVASRAASGNQSPLFFWLEWLLVQSLGKSEWTLRLPSLIAGCALPAALYFALVRWSGLAGLGVLAAWLVAIDPRQIFYATEARPYALVELLAVAHVALLLELLQRPTLRLRLLFVAGAALLFHLHCTAALLLAAELAIFACSRCTSPGRAYGGWSFACDLFLIAALGAPALPGLEAVYARRGNWNAFVPQKPATEILALWPASLAAVIPLMAIDLFVRKTAGRAPGQELPPLAILLWAIVPVALAWLATASDAARLLFPRYLLASAPAATLLAVLCVRMISWRSLQIVVGLGIAALALRTSHVVEHLVHDGRPIHDRLDDWRGAIAHFNDRPNRDRFPVLVRSWLIEADELQTAPSRELEDYCLYPVTALYPIAAEHARLIPLSRSGAGNLRSDVRQQIRSSGGVWLIVGGRQEVAAAIVKEAAASLSGPAEPPWKVVEQASFGKVHILRLGK